MSRRNIAIYRARRIIALLIALAGVAGVVILSPDSYEQVADSSTVVGASDGGTSGDSAANHAAESNVPLASDILKQLPVKGRAPKTGYTRTEFYSNWPEVEGCSLRQRIIRREVGDTAVLADDKCTVVSGEYTEPYTGKHLVFSQKSDFTTGVQIDHVVALSDAWQKGAQQLDKDTRYQLATDPLNLLAVDASANQGKSDGDAATWLPANKSFRCQYVARQVSVKYKYNLWVTEAEKTAIERVLENCPSEPAVGVTL